MNQISFSDKATEVLRATADRYQHSGAKADDAFYHDNIDLVNESVTFIQCLTKLIAMGGNCYKESDTMIVCDTTRGMTVGMHFDGTSWSLNS